MAQFVCHLLLLQGIHIKWSMINDYDDDDDDDKKILTLNKYINNNLSHYWIGST